jgi:hypothetical protein
VASDTKSNHFVGVSKLLIQLTQVGIVSLLEVHQQFSAIQNNISYRNDDAKWDNEEHIFLKKKSFLRLILKQILNKRFALFLRRNHISVVFITNIILFFLQQNLSVNKD